MKVALVHDYLMEYGGAERVLEALHELWPDAPVYTSLFDEKKLKSQIVFSSGNSNLKTKVQISKLQGVPLASRLSKTLTFFYPLIFENLDLREYDLVISDGTIWSKGVLTTPEQLHIFYCHTPPRFLYHYEGETDRRCLWYLKPLLAPLDLLLRVWDFESAQRPDFIVANSKTTAARIRKFWHREATVIYPPVGIVSENSENSVNQKISESENQIFPEDHGSGASGLSGIPTHRGTDAPSRSEFSEDYFLVVSRLSAYKNVDLAIEACNELKVPLVVVGTGREEKRLQKMAGPTVKLLGFVKDSKLYELYQNCRALIHPTSDEDFGLAPVEAMNFGKPVIALRSAQGKLSGVEETVIEGKTGLFFNEPTAASLVEVLSHYDTVQYHSRDCVAQAARFSKERFQREFRDFVKKRLRERSGGKYHYA